MKPAVLHPEARIELIEAARYDAAIEPGLGQRTIRNPRGAARKQGKTLSEIAEERLVVA